MKMLSKYTIGVLLCVIIFFSCKKERSCEGCINGNKPPIAVAGPDQVATLPTDSISLDGSASNDADGTISEWRWKEISGPASSNIVNAAASKTVVRDLDTGVYRFELKVTDNGNLSATDTVQITVTDSGQPNRPPIANAGPDQTITLPTNGVNLDGSSSTDPDNNIIGYLWTKISGPTSFNIANANAVQTQMSNLVQGVYQFELKVTDAGGLVSTDPIQVTVNAQPPPPSATCDPLNRPLVNAQLIPVGNLSMARDGMTTITADNIIFFAGGYTSSGNYQRADVSRVDIYNVLTQTWSQTELSVPRSYIAAVAIGDRVFFAGGSLHSADNLTSVSSRVDIYNITTQTWSTAELSQARGEIAAAGIGNKVFFAGGYRNIQSPDLSSSRVDIFDLSTQTWSTAELVEPRGSITAVTAQNKIYFAGGDLGGGIAGSSNKIDIYDDNTGAWSVSSLNEGKAFFAGIYKNGKIYWAGGTTYFDNGGLITLSCKVEIKDLNSQVSTFANLFHPQGAVTACEKNNKIIFMQHDGAWAYYSDLPWSFDIYDITTNSWLIGTVNQSPLFWPGSWISHNNIIYLAGGNANNSNYSSQVWKLEF